MTKADFSDNDIKRAKVAKHHHIIVLKNLNQKKARHCEEPLFQVSLRNLKVLKAQRSSLLRFAVSFGDCFVADAPRNDGLLLAMALHPDSENATR